MLDISNYDLYIIYLSFNIPYFSIVYYLVRGLFFKYLFISVIFSLCINCKTIALYSSDFSQLHGK